LGYAFIGAFLGTVIAPAGVPLLTSLYSGGASTASITTPPGNTTVEADEVLSSSATRSVGPVTPRGYVDYGVEDQPFAGESDRSRGASSPDTGAHYSSDRELREPGRADKGGSNRLSIEAPHTSLVASPLTAEAPDASLRYNVTGSWGAEDRMVLEAALAAAFAEADWTPTPVVGGHALFVSGSIREMEPTLGQIPTSSATLRWELRAGENGRVVKQGGINDVRGTGTDSPAARNATMARAARQIVGKIILR
jgi:hypothetical protein